MTSRSLPAKKKADLDAIAMTDHDAEVDAIVAELVESGLVTQSRV